MNYFDTDNGKQMQQSGELFFGGKIQCLVCYLYFIFCGMVLSLESGCVHLREIFRRTADSETRRQCDQIWRFYGLWATFKSLRQQLICPNLPTFLGNFYRHLAIFIWSHCQKARLFFNIWPFITFKAAQNINKNCQQILLNTK